MDELDEFLNAEQVFGVEVLADYANMEPLGVESRPCADPVQGTVSETPGRCRQGVLTQISQERTRCARTIRDNMVSNRMLNFWFK